MEKENLIPESLTEEELMVREDRCRKSIKTVGKAVFMRLLVTGILLWVTLQPGMELWIVGLMVFVLIITISGLLPLGRELRKKYRELKEILAKFE